MPPSFVRFAAGALCFGMSQLAYAQPVHNDLNSPQELSADGWSEFAGGSSMYSDGIMQIPQGGYDEWGLPQYSDGSVFVWGTYVSGERGWWVEARVKLDPPQGAQNHGQGLDINDGTSAVTLKWGPNDVMLVTDVEAHHAFNTVGDFHVYRVQRPSADVVELLIDGERVLQVATPEKERNHAAGLVFGSMDEFYGAYWDYIAYDTAAPGTEEQDDDGDGLALSRDTCPEVADTGTDSDHDRIGDACDICVNDVNDDVDGDGACADEDLCPSNPDNPDENDNRVCDDDECKAGMPQGFEFARTGSEGAQLCAVGDLSCLCYNRAAANCSPKATCEFGCDCRWAGFDAGAAPGGAWDAGSLTGLDLRDAGTLSAGSSSVSGDESAIGVDSSRRDDQRSSASPATSNAAAPSSSVGGASGAESEEGLSTSLDSASNVEPTAADDGGDCGCRLASRRLSPPAALLLACLFGVVALRRSNKGGGR